MSITIYLLSLLNISTGLHYQNKASDATTKKNNKVDAMDPTIKAVNKDIQIPKVTQIHPLTENHDDINRANDLIQIKDVKNIKKLLETIELSMKDMSMDHNMLVHSLKFLKNSSLNKFDPSNENVANSVHHLIIHNHSFNDQKNYDNIYTNLKSTTFKTQEFKYKPIKTTITTSKADKKLSDINFVRETFHNRFHNQTCGTDKKLIMRISSGKQSEQNQWPWLAYFGKNNIYEFKCGAAYIGFNGWILSAAHCFDNLDPKSNDLFVVVNDYDRKTKDGEIFVHIKKVIIHHRYQRQTSNTTVKNDIALIQLQPSKQLSYLIKTIEPLCLTNEPTFIGQLCVMAGWGKTSASSSLSLLVNEATVPIVSLNECNNLNIKNASKQTSIEKGFICAGYGRLNPSDNLNPSACSGDSGGPLMCKNKKMKYILSGVISWGSLKCLGNMAYTVFSDVYSYLDWVKVSILTNTI